MLKAFIIFPLAAATPILWSGRAPVNFTEADIDASIYPYNSAVHGSNNASHYISLLGPGQPPTPLWNSPSSGLYFPPEQSIEIGIDNSSVFVPGGNQNNAQYGFRRTELIARSPTGNVSIFETGTTVFHFSLMLNPLKPLNLKHEYQNVFIEPSDGTHVFGLQIGSDFSVPTEKPNPAKNATMLRILDHSLEPLFSTEAIPLVWHNFAVQVDWEALTLAVLYSQGASSMKVVTKANQNNSAGPVGTTGDYHFGLLKLPLADPSEPPSEQGDVVHHGIQEGDSESLIYSGVFIESATGGINIGYGQTVPVVTP